MEILKYKKKGNSNYQIEFTNGVNIKIHEDLILKYNLLYKKDIDEYFLDDLKRENNQYDIYNKCLNYLSKRIRSTKEMVDFMSKKDISNELIFDIIDRLTKNNYLNDELFTKAYINDKLNFTTKGPLKIREELKYQQIDNNIIDKYLSNIDRELLDEKINKLINKIIKSSKNKDDLRNKIYYRLVSLGYYKEQIITNLNKYNF